MARTSPSAAAASLTQPRPIEYGVVDGFVAFVESEKIERACAGEGMKSSATTCVFRRVFAEEKMLEIVQDGVTA